MAADGKIRIKIEAETDDAEKALEGFEGTASGVGKTLAGAFSAKMFVDFMKAGYEAFENVEAGANAVKAATGATGEAAEGLVDVYKDVATHVVGSFEDIGSAVGELNTMFGLEGDELEAAGEAAMQFAKVNGTDVTESIHNVAQMMNNAGIESSQYANVLDMLTVAAQQSGIDVDTLTTSVNNNAASLREMGFSTEESIAMLANFEKSGANTSQILAGMKRGIANWAQEGKDASAEFQSFIGGVQDGSVSMADAIDIFGARAGATMYDAAQKGQLDFQGMYDAIAESSEGALEGMYEETLTSSERLELVGQNMQVLFADTLAPIMEDLEPVIESVCGKIQEFVDWWEQAPEGVKLAIGVLGAAAVAIALVVAALTTLSGILPVVTAVQGAFNLSLLSSPITWVVVGIVALIAAIVLLVTHFDQVKEVVVGLWESLRDKFAAGVEFLRTTVDGIKTAVTEKFSALASAASAIFERVKYNITHPIEAAKNTVKSIVDKIKSFFNFNVSLPNIKLPHFAINPPGWQLGDLMKGKIPTLGINWYATGGVFNGPSVIGVGEAGPEAVIPLSSSRAASQIGDALGGTPIDYALLGQAVADAIGRAGIGFSIDGRRMATVLAPALDRVNGQRVSMSARGVAQA